MPNPEWNNGGSDNIVGAFIRGTAQGQSFVDNAIRNASQIQQNQQAALLFPLKMQEMDLENQTAKANLISRGLDINQKKAEMADAIAFKDAQQQVNLGNDATPSFSTKAYASEWQAWKSKTDLGERVTQERSTFAKRVAALPPGAPISFVLGIPPDQNGLPTSEAWSALSEIEKQSAAEQESMRLNREREKQQEMETRQVAVKRADAQAKLSAQMDKANAFTSTIKNRTLAMAMQSELRAVDKDPMLTTHEQKSDAVMAIYNRYQEMAKNPDAPAPAASAAPEGSRAQYEAYDAQIRAATDELGKLIKHKATQDWTAPFTKSWDDRINAQKKVIEALTKERDSLKNGPSPTPQAGGAGAGNLPVIPYKYSSSNRLLQKTGK